MANAIPQELTGLLDALHDGVTDLAKGTAVKQLDHWHDLLAEANKPELKAISRDIDSLRKLLSADGSADGRKIGAVMVKLADHIEGLTDTDAGKGIKTRLHTLGRLLRSEGTELTGS
ncbi:MAG: hypothetical protein H7Z41_03055 [Cytophagales bacterium]|nr:hypothetical protein [Armatimonadota bacterium]